MSTHREYLQQKFYKKMENYDELVRDINERARHLGNETYLTHLRLYKEQKDQMEDIMRYFDQAGVEPSKNTTEAILTLALQEFHQYLMGIKNGEK
ncbi:hypothetical protein SAMN05192534_1189 [Alteribacillus persepolensis]|uniref:Uncharacterized protein n=1 Tax=Alteribacillus persepolensis TaxID=568899 RepID=A0A1G8H1C7_9BACI|nr:hypothetical protein [Alteribacillus persepolensis]SDI00468.1 hypothetical protein SAMN05192534_1189 [Alteribacillus persepolensis]